MKKILLTLSEGNAAFINDVFSEISIILKDPLEKPSFKYGLHKVYVNLCQIVLYNLLLAEPDAYKAFDQYLFDFLKNLSLFNRNEKPQIRGEPYFTSTKRMFFHSFRLLSSR